MGGILSLILSSVIGAGTYSTHPADFNRNGRHEASDLAKLLGNWGECEDCDVDLSPVNPVGSEAFERFGVRGDGQVGAADLASYLSFAEQSDTLTLGVNVDGTCYYCPTWFSADIFKSSGSWTLTKQDGTQFRNDEVPTRENGFPILEEGDIFSALMLRDLNGHYPAGTYEVEWEGTAEVNIRGFDVDGVDWGHPIRMSGTDGQGSFPVSNPGNGGIIVTVEQSDPSDPIRSLKIWMPDKRGERHHPLFVERLRGFDFIRTAFMFPHGRNEPMSWEDRPRLNDVRWTHSKKGVPIEVMVDLANELQTDLWVTVPHSADSSYKLGMFELIHQNLDTNLKLYVEHSNEFWNTAQVSGQWYIGRASDAPEYCTTASQCLYEAYAHDALDSFEKLDRVFSSPEDQGRIRKVVGAHLMNSWISDQVLSAIERLSGEPASEAVDILSPSSYFGVGPADVDEDPSVEELAQLARDSMLERVGRMQSQVAVAEDFGLKILSYEGGQHIADIVGTNAAFGLAVAEINRSPVMEELYDEWIQKLYNLSETWTGFAQYTYCSFTDVRGLAFGMLEYQDQSPDDAPKLRALRKYR